MTQALPLAVRPIVVINTAARIGSQSASAGSAPQSSTPTDLYFLAGGVMFIGAFLLMLQVLTLALNAIWPGRR